MCDTCDVAGSLFPVKDHDAQCVPGFEEPPLGDMDEFGEALEVQTQGRVVAVNTSRLPINNWKHNAFLDRWGRGPVGKPDQTVHTPDRNQARAGLAALGLEYAVGGPDVPSFDMSINYYEHIKNWNARTDHAPDYEQIHRVLPRAGVDNYGLNFLEIFTVRFSKRIFLRTVPGFSQNGYSVHEPTVFPDVDSSFYIFSHFLIFSFFTFTPALLYCNPVFSLVDIGVCNENV
mmetsp:Transcript_33361/g.72779  ORF Transcript_33361/g.72779 Transcript_33361/m.72779 type:complete len:231 (+) Transcript_33361:1378-2070(+)